jgi:hypothetical protein
MNDLVQECATQVVKVKPLVKAQLKLMKHSPEIMIGVGIIGVVTSTILACKATLKAPAVIADAKQKFADIEVAVTIDSERVDAGEPSVFSKKDRQQELVAVSFQTGYEFTKLYAVPVVIMVASMLMITKGHGITMKRNAAISSAFAALSSAYTEYRKRVREQYGEDVERNLYYGVKEETIEYTDEKGKVKKEKVSVIEGHSIYARFFDDASPAWSPSPELNLTFLRCQQNYANDMLRVNGHMFLNEIYDMLGLERTKEGAVVGWKLSKDGDNYVDFGIYDITNRERRMFVNGNENVILLDFNVDGIMYDLI